MPEAPAPPALVDSHCHLVFAAFSQDLAAVQADAARQGVARIVNPGTDLDDSRAATQLAQAHASVYAAVGLHPHQAGRAVPHYLDSLHALAQRPKVAAIGEIGLDYYRDRTPPERQISCFREQLELAAALGLPVIIHCRAAQADTLRILAEWIAGDAFRRSALAQAPHPGILHAFGGEAEEARQARALGFLLGLGGPVTFRNARALRRMVAGLDPDQIVLETDAPFLSPHPFRGQRNAPGRLPLICAGVAAALGLPPADVARATSANAARLFGWPVPLA